MTRTKEREQDAAELEIERFESALGPFVVAAETTRMPMIFCNAKDAGHPLIFANDSFLALTGYSRKELLGQPIEFLMNPQRRGQTWGSPEPEFGREGGGTTYCECRRKDRSVFRAAIFTSPVRDREDEIVQHFASFVDITTQVHQAERDASALHTLCENTPGFICILTGPDHEFEFANAAYLKLVGHETLLGRRVADAMPELVGQGFVALLDRVFTSGEPFIGKNVEVKFQRGVGEDEERRLVDFIYQPVRDSRQVVTGIFCEGQDVTELAAAEERVLRLQSQLIHASRVSAMGTMAATLAHELNQPLTAISNYAAACRFMLASNDDPASIDHALVAVGDGSKRAGDIIRRLRDMTLGRGTHRERFDLSEAVEESLTLVQAGACHGRDIQFHPGRAVTVEADRVQIQQVVMNLARNACEAASPTDGQVKVSVSVSGAEACVSVDDSGPGIAAGSAGKLFEWGQTSKPEGTGIGLSISRTIIDAHKGRIWHDSQHDEATRFCFTLPAAKDPEAPLPKSSARQRDGGAGRRKLPGKKR